MGISGCSNHATINQVSVKGRSKKTKKHYNQQFYRERRIGVEEEQWRKQ
jgi:hypothetical protein